VVGEKRGRATNTFPRREREGKKKRNGSHDFKRKLAWKKGEGSLSLYSEKKKEENSRIEAKKRGGKEGRYFITSREGEGGGGKLPGDL